MKIACLQFAPAICEVDDNIARADELLKDCKTGDIELLVLGELAFTGM